MSKEPFDPLITTRDVLQGGCQASVDVYSTKERDCPTDVRSEVISARAARMGPRPSGALAG